MVRFKYGGGGVLLALVCHDVLSRGRASSLLSERCSAMCLRRHVGDALRTLCQRICNSVEAHVGEACFQAIGNSSDEHLTLLSYSSGHIVETATILAGAVVEENPELSAYVNGLHVQDRGSPDGCADVHDAHYCVAQGSSGLPFGPILGLCVPSECNSAELTNLVLNITAFNELAPSAHAAYPEGELEANNVFRLVGSLVVICGGESRLSADVGTTFTLILVGCLVALVIVGTRLEYRDRLVLEKREKHSSRRTLVSDGDSKTSQVGDVHQLPQTNRSFTPPSLESHERVRGDETSGTAKSDVVPDDRVPLSGPKDEARSSSCTEAKENLFDGRFIEPNEEESMREPLLDDRPTDVGNLRSEESQFATCLKCFSLYTNLSKLFAPPRASNEFGALDGVRTISIIWVVFSHSILFWGSSTGFTNMGDFLPMDGHGFLARWTAQPILGGSYAVDSFFLMSGFLVSCTLLPRLESGSVGKGPWLLKVYLHRYLRLTPTVAFITLIRWQLFPLISDSPAWWSFATTVRENCRKQWWGEITYISNLVPWPPMLNRCNIITYYLADDVQFFLASVPLLALYLRHPRITIGILLSVMVASWGYTMWFTFDKDIPSSFIASRPLARETSKVYATPWCRNSAYIIGVLCGILWHSWLRGRVAAAARQRQESQESQTFYRYVQSRQGRCVVVLVIISALLLALPIYGAYWGNQDAQDVQVPDWLDHMHYVLGRSSWALGLALMCGLCFSGYGGFVNNFLTLGPWTVLSRLTFCIYLSHTFLVEWLCNSRDLARRFTSYELAVAFMGTVVGAIALASAVHLLVEAPFRNLESLSRRRRRDKMVAARR